MELPPIVAEWVATNEQEIGRKPTIKEIQIAEAIENVGQAMENRGREDSLRGRAKPAEGYFHNWCMKEFDVHELAEKLAGFLESRYMRGYIGEVQQT